MNDLSCGPAPVPKVRWARREISPGVKQAKVDRSGAFVSWDSWQPVKPFRKGFSDTPVLGRPDAAQRAGGHNTTNLQDANWCNICHLSQCFCDMQPS